MDGNRELSCDDLAQIKRVFADLAIEVGPTDYAAFATALLRAFEERERQLVFWQGEFRCFNPNRGVFALVAELEIQDLCLDLIGKRGSTPSRLVGALKSRAYVAPSYFDAGRNAYTCVDVTIILDVEDRADPIKYERHSSRFRTLVAAPVTFEYGNKAKDELHQFLEQTIPDAVARERLLELVGLALLGKGTLQHKMVVFFGEGANGKSVLIDLIGGLFSASQRTSVSPDELINDYGRAALDGSRLNSLSELDSLSPKELKWLKAAIGGNEMNARRVGGNGFQLVPQALHIVATNEIPRLGKATVALERRLVLIRTPNVVPENRRDPFLIDKLRQALPELLRMCLDAAERALRRQFEGAERFPQSVQMIADAKLLFGADSIEEFISRRLVITLNAEDKVHSPRLHEFYVDDCAMVAVVPKPPAQLRRALTARKVEVRKSNGIEYLVGIRVTDDSGGLGTLGSQAPRPIEADGPQPHPAP
jgi:hypothetical protein